MTDIRSIANGTLFPVEFVLEAMFSYLMYFKFPRQGRNIISPCLLCLRLFLIDCAKKRRRHLNNACLSRGSLQSRKGQLKEQEQPMELAGDRHGMEGRAGFKYAV